MVLELTTSLVLVEMKLGLTWSNTLEEKLTFPLCLCPIVVDESKTIISNNKQ